MKKKGSENDQLSGQFQSFLFIFFHHTDPKSEFFSRKSTDKKNPGLSVNSLFWALALWHGSWFFFLI